MEKEFDVYEFILGALVEYNNANTPEEKYAVYNKSMAVLRPSGDAQPSEKE